MLSDTAVYSDKSVLNECGLDEKTLDVLYNNIQNKLTSQAVKIRADIEVACYGYEGIDAVKAALRAGLACSTPSLPIKINLIAPPLYGKSPKYLWLLSHCASEFLKVFLFFFVQVFQSISSFIKLIFDLKKVELYLLGTSKKNKIKK